MTDEAAERVLTVPNVLSVVRLLCMPVFLWLLFGRDNRAGAAALLAVLGATDWVDGYIARRFGQVSELGKVLDPTADRILLVVGIGAIIVDGSAPLWLSVIVVAREVLVAIAAIAIAALGARRMDVLWAGKAGTFGFMFAFPFFLAGESTVSWREVAHVLGWLCALPALAFSLYAAAAYVPAAKVALRDGRVRPRAG